MQYLYNQRSSEIIVIENGGNGILLTTYDHGDKDLQARETSSGHKNSIGTQHYRWL